MWLRLLTGCWLGSWASGSTVAPCDLWFARGREEKPFNLCPRLRFLSLGENQQHKRLTTAQLHNHCDVYDLVKGHTEQKGRLYENRYKSRTLPFSKLPYRATFIFTGPHQPHSVSISTLSTYFPTFKICFTFLYHQPQLVIPLDYWRMPISQTRF